MNPIKNQNPDQTTRNIKIKGGKQIPCSLLIPEQMLSILQNQLEKYSSMNEFISDLVQQFGHPEQDLGQPDLYNNHLTTRYQNEGQSLQKVDFRIKPETWHSLKLLARNRGISICFLFVQFLLFLSSASVVFIPYKSDPSVSARTFNPYYYAEYLKEFRHVRALPLVKNPGNPHPPYKLKK